VLRASFWPHIAGRDLSGPSRLAKGNFFPFWMVTWEWGTSK